MKRYFIGLDLSLTESGMCILDAKGKIKELVLLPTEAVGDLPRNRFNRYDYIKVNLQVASIPYILKAKGIAIEHYSYASKGRITQLVELGCLVRKYFLQYKKAQLIEVAPIQLKKFVLGKVHGKGKSSKNVMCREVFKRYKVNIDNDNLIDAFLLAELSRQYYFFTRKKRSPKLSFQKEVVEAILKKRIKEKKTFKARDVNPKKWKVLRGVR